MSLFSIKLCRPVDIPNGDAGRSSVSPDVGYPLYRERTPSFLCEKFMGANGLSKKRKQRSYDDDDVFGEMDGPRRFHPKPILRHNRTQIFSAKDSATMPANVKSPFADQRPKRKSVFVFPTFQSQRPGTSDDLALEERKRGQPVLVSATMNCAEIIEQDGQQSGPPSMTTTKKKLGPTNSINISGPTSQAPPPPTPPPISDVGTKRTQKREQFKRGKQRVIRRKSTHDLDILRLPSEASFSCTYIQVIE